MAVPKQPPISGWLLDFVAVAVVLGWLATLVVSLADRSYQQPLEVHLLMISVAGSLFGFRLVTRNGGPE